MVQTRAMHNARPRRRVFQPELFCDRAATCLSTGYAFEVYHRRDLPAKLHHALLQAFRTDDIPESERSRKAICRGSVKQDYLIRALSKCKYVAIGTHQDRVVSVVLAQPHTSRFETSGERVCLPHELYVDVACSDRDTL